MLKRLLVLGLALLGSGLTGCGDPRSHSQAVYVLIDTSGTYAQESAKAQLIINYLLGTLQPGDSLAVARVESRSFSEKDIIAKATFDVRPSQANAQKRAFRDATDGVLKGVKQSPYTDSRAGLVRGPECLDEPGARSQALVVFSDMQEELDKITQRDVPMNRKRIRVVAVSVLKLNTDSIVPRRYFGRLEA